VRINNGAVPEIDGHAVCIGAGVIVEADQVWSVQDRNGLRHRRRGRVGQCKRRCVEHLRHIADKGRATRPGARDGDALAQIEIGPEAVSRRQGGSQGCAPSPHRRIGNILPIHQFGNRGNQVRGPGNGNILAHVGAS
jgi:hypothetical protein